MSEEQKNVAQETATENQTQETNTEVKVETPKQNTFTQEQLDNIIKSRLEAEQRKYEKKLQEEENQKLKKRVQKLKTQMHDVVDEAFSRSVSPAATITTANNNNNKNHISSSSMMLSYNTTPNHSPRGGGVMLFGSSSSGSSNCVIILTMYPVLANFRPVQRFESHCPKSHICNLIGKFLSFINCCSFFCFAIDIPPVPPLINFFLYFL